MLESLNQVVENLKADNQERIDQVSMLNIFCKFAQCSFQGCNLKRRCSCKVDSSRPDIP